VTVLVIVLVVFNWLAWLLLSTRWSLVQLIPTMVVLSASEWLVPDGHGKYPASLFLYFPKLNAVPPYRGHGCIEYV
jgi:hypothetical protein